MATDPNRLLRMANTGVVPVQRPATTPGTGFPEAQKLATQRINQMPPPAFDTQVRELAQPAQMSQEGIQRLRNVQTLGAPAPINNLPGGLTNMMGGLRDRPSILDRLPPGFAEQRPDVYAQLMANQARREQHWQARDARREARQQNRQARIQDILAARRPGLLNQPPPGTPGSYMAYGYQGRG